MLPRAAPSRGGSSEVVAQKAVQTKQAKKRAGAAEAKAKKLATLETLLENINGHSARTEAGQRALDETNGQRWTSHVKVEFVNSPEPRLVCWRRLTHDATNQFEDELCSWQTLASDPWAREALLVSVAAIKTALERRNAPAFGWFGVGDGATTRSQTSLLELKTPQTLSVPFWCTDTSSGLTFPVVRVKGKLCFVLAIYHAVLGLVPWSVIVAALGTECPLNAKVLDVMLNLGVKTAQVKNLGQDRSARLDELLRNMPEGTYVAKVSITHWVALLVAADGTGVVIDSDPDKQTPCALSWASFDALGYEGIGEVRRLTWNEKGVRRNLKKRKWESSEDPSNKKKKRRTE